MNGVCSCCYGGFDESRDYERDPCCPIHGKAETPATDVNAGEVQTQKTLTALRDRLIKEAVECTTLLQNADRNGKYLIAHENEIRRSVWLLASDWVLEVLSSQGVSDHAAGVLSENIPSDLEIAQFLTEFDEGKHPLSVEDELALEQSRPMLFKMVKQILASPVAPVGQPEADEEAIAQIVNETGKQITEMLQYDFAALELMALHGILNTAIRKAKSAPVGEVHEGQTGGVK